MTSAKAALPPVLAWSYSRYSDYKQCPAKFMYKHLHRLPDPGSAAMQRGNDIHKLAEDFVRGKIDLPDELKHVEREANHLKDNMATVEQSWGFRKDWAWIGRPGWFGDDVWFRAKADAIVVYEDDTALLIDWKTGKKYFTNEEQIELFALAGFQRYPNLTEVDTRLWYTDIPDPQQTGENEIQRIYSRKDADAIQRDWDKKVIPMFKDRRFAPTPNDKCGWCPFSRVKGGPCKF